MRHRSAIIAAVVGVALAGLVALLAFSPQGGDGAASASPVVGKVAPALVGTTADGQSFDLDKHRGQWVLVNFFATWCPPCVAEHPELVRLAGEQDGTLQVVSVAAGDTAEKVTEFFAEKGGDWPVLVTDTEAASIDYGLIKLPESYLIAPDGTVVEKYIGGITAEQVEARIARGAGTGAGGPASSTVVGAGS